ncbi:pyridoxal phosphate-dependent aminotransferase [Corticibacter populi]|uniref:Aminotransferase n=1 Tax=Corticibacter populi TaxID=1550736 RepID=A0A3M6QY43_9BURK|nr:pyridoxal phosphate-dependent aminotransferase [Corticibacter populi]RMX07793.1 pyridoxal phosphate-dependent aminotransferase [Corticibacter populi]
MPYRPSERALRTSPFYVMEVAKAAERLVAERGDQPPMIYLNIGEPDFTAPPLVQQAAIAAISAGQTQYTPALGIMPLRQAISRWYAERFGVAVAAERVVITAGASAALQLACLALLQAGDEMLLPDPGYPCNQQFVQAADARARLLPVGPEGRFQLDAQCVAEHWGPQTRGVLLASPSNPTGTSLAPSELAAIHREVKARGGITLVDEIYLGLSYDSAYGQTALVLGEDVISINSFSKYFNMTGWRLGWLVLPAELVAPVERLCQNLFICPSAIAQRAALACFAPESLAEYERRRDVFRQRRDLFLPQLGALGLEVPVAPDGAFYIWADCQEAARRLGARDSWDFAFALLERARIAVAPGRDFGHNGMERFVRFSIANSSENLQQAIDRMRALLA